MAGIYIHIPFCKTRCSYCDFYSSTDIAVKDTLVTCICKELQAERKYIDNEAIETIYFGGGTPSLLEEKDFKAIFDTIQSYYDTSICKEITLEANPDDLSLDYILMLKKFPFNRISIGIQSFINKELQLINRRHTSEQAIEAVKLCQRNGFENISIDLIYGYPSQTINNFSTSIDKVLEINPTHISAYHLSYEKGTALEQKLARKEIQAVDEEISNKMYRLLVEKLKKRGYIQYEISNFAKPSFESKHNSSYWSCKKYLGIGPSAHSYNGDSRKWNVSSIQEYTKGIKKGTVICTLEVLSLYERYNDYIINSLRTMQGASIAKIQNEFGDKLLKYFMENSAKHLKNKTLRISNNYLTIADEGIFLSDGIIADLVFVD